MKTFLITLLILLSSAFTYADSVKVNFTYNNQAYHVVGKEVLGGYRFNEGAKKTVNLSTLNWAPYVGENICNKGWIFQVTIALLVSQGYEVNVSFRPWKRSVMEVEKGITDILFPEYFIEENASSDIYENSKRLSHLALSHPIPGGPIVFMKRTSDDKDRYNGDLLSLKNEKIGVVRGYQNTPEFDKLMDEQFFDIIESSDDLLNVKMLVAGRVNLIIGDPTVIQYTVKTSKMTRSQKKNTLNQFQVVHPIIKNKPLYFAISRKSEHWQQILKDINTAIDSFTKTGELSNIIKQTKQLCGFDQGFLVDHY